MLDHGYYHSSLFPTVSKPVLLGCKYTVKQRRDVSKHLHFSNQIAKLSSSSVPAQSNLNWDLHFNQEFPVRFGCCKRQSWSTWWVDQQYFDCTTWPCLTHALRPTHSLRFALLVLWKCGILGLHVNFSLKCPLDSCKYPARYTVSGALACYAGGSMYMVIITQGCFQLCQNLCY